MNVIYDRVPSECIGCGDDSTLNHSVIKLCQTISNTFVSFEQASSSGDNYILCLYLFIRNNNNNALYEMCFIFSEILCCLFQILRKLCFMI